MSGERNNNNKQRLTDLRPPHNVLLQQSTDICIMGNVLFVEKDRIIHSYANQSAFIAKWPASREGNESFQNRILVYLHDRFISRFVRHKFAGTVT